MKRKQYIIPSETEQFGTIETFTVSSAEGDREAGFPDTMTLRRSVYINDSGMDPDVSTLEYIPITKLHSYCQESGDFSAKCPDCLTIYDKQEWKHCPACGFPEELEEEKDHYMAAVEDVLHEMYNFLQEKHNSYGRAAEAPVKWFSDLTAKDRISVRLDDKLNRVLRGNEFPFEDTVKDFIGYWILREALKKISPETEK